MMLLGAHLDRSHVDPVPTVVPIDLERIVLSAFEIGAGQSASDPKLFPAVIDARSALLDIATYIAIRWGSIVDSVESARDACATRLESWRRTLQESQGLVEMTFKAGGQGRPARPDVRAVVSGEDYLRQLHRMRRDIDVDSAMLRRAEELFAPCSVESRRFRRDDGGVEIALLVDRERIEEITEAGRRLRSDYSDAPFLLSGPWPLEVFAE